jgi:lycopene cyclase domain-containing protein
MEHLTYLALLAGCLVVTAPLELVLRVRVYARWRRLLLALVPELVVFGVWEIYAVARHHWAYDGAQVLPPRVAGMPVEELLFFLVVPVCAVLALEAVRKVTGWDAGYPATPSDGHGSIAARPAPTGSEHRSEFCERGAERPRRRRGRGERGADRGAEPGVDMEAE